MTNTVSTPRAIAARNGLFAVFGANGFAFATWMSRVPDVKDILDLTPGNLGIMLLSVSVGSLMGLPVAGRIILKIGGRNTVRAGVTFMMSGLLLAAAAVTFGSSMFLVMPGLYLVGLGAGVWDVAQNFEGTYVERAVGRAIMPWFHAAFSGGTVLGALLGAGFVALRIPVLPHLVAAVILAATATLWGVTKFLGTDSEAFAEGEETTAPVSQRSAWLEPRTLLIGLVVLAAAFAEGTANDWLAVAFVDGHGVDNALGVVALAVFLSFMTAGRILGTNLLDRYGRVPVLVTMFVLAIVGCLLVVFGNAVIAFAGAAVWGVGASLGFPVGMSAAADDPQRAPMRLSVVSTIGYGAFLAGPPFLGFLGDHVGVLFALLAVGATSILALAVVPATRPLTK